MADSGFSYGWNSARQRYVDLNTGRFVAERDVLRIMQDRIDDGLTDIRALISSLVDGGADVAEWQAAVQLELKNIHTQHAALGSGGWNQVSSRTWGEVGSRLAAEYKYLNGFASEIAAGNLSAGQIETRLGMYIDGAWGSFFDSQTNAMEDEGFDEEMRELEGGADHCDDCISDAGHWEEINTLPDIGDSQCGSRCRCTKRYRNTVTGQEA